MAGPPKKDRHFFAASLGVLYITVQPCLKVGIGVTATTTALGIAAATAAYVELTKLMDSVTSKIEDRLKTEFKVRFARGQVSK